MASKGRQAAKWKTETVQRADTQRSTRLAYQVISKVLNLFLTVVANGFLGNRNLSGSNKLQLTNFKAEVLFLYQITLTGWGFFCFFSSSWLLNPCKLLAMQHGLARYSTILLHAVIDRHLPLVILNIPSHLAHQKLRRVCKLVISSLRHLLSRMKSPIPFNYFL